MTTFLILEDENTKAVSYQRFAAEYGFNFVIAPSPHRALEMIAEAPDRLHRLAGVIADFEVDGLAPHRGYNRTVAQGPDGEYTVSTGLGVLDWFHAQAPDLPLWAMTSVAAAHAPLYMSAASLWLDAKPLHVDRMFGSAGTAVAETLAAELQDPGDYVRRNPHWPLIDDSRPAFEAMLDAPHQGIEAFDWIHALVRMRRATPRFDSAVQDNLRKIVGDPAVRAHNHTLAPAMARWQYHLEEVYRDFPVEREAELWPAIDLAHLPTKLSFWEFNPFLDFLRDNDECREFFVSADIRVALRRYRLAQGAGAAG